MPDPHDEPSELDPDAVGYRWGEVAGGDRTPSEDLGWAHHDVALAGEVIVTFQSAGDGVVLLDRSLRPISTWRTGLVDGHGLTVTGDPDAPELWIADPGDTMTPTREGTYRRLQPRPHGQVVRFTLDGALTATLDTPDHPAYRTQRFAPTSVAVADGPGEDGSVWVADGYGADLVHRYGADLVHRTTLTGEEGAGRFACPHDVGIDRRGPEPLLYVTDRQHGRIQVYDLDGRYVREVYEGLRSPSNTVTWGEHLIVAELHARLTVLDGRDRVIGYLGRDDVATERPGWPNLLTDLGTTVRPPLRPHAFNSPHGLAVDAAGALYVAEWVIGGRLTRLHLEGGSR